MLVVADSSPLIVLVNIGHIDVLVRLFGEVLIPPAVAAELRSEARPPLVREFIGSRPSWLQERMPQGIEPIGLLHPGELAAINLAMELHADLLLIDDMQGRQAAADRHIPFTGTVGVLELAARREMLDLAEAFERVKATDFWISPRLLDERLRLFNGAR